MNVARAIPFSQAGFHEARFAVLLVCVGALTASGCSGPVADRAENHPVMAATASAAYKIGPQDVLEISVFNLPELNRTIQVSDMGSINFPLIGDVSTVGKTAREIEAEVAARLNARYIRSPQVTVFVKEFNSQHATVDGAVKKPGVFPLRDKNSLLQMVALAGGLDTDVSGSAVVVFRQGPDGTTTLRFDIEAIRSGRMADPPIQNGDTITVETSDGKIVLNDVGKVAPVFNLLRVVP